MENNKLTSVPDLEGPKSINLLSVAIVPSSFCHVSKEILSYVLGKVNVLAILLTRDELEQTSKHVTLKRQTASKHI